ncbi:N-acetylmuramoyl-L-alanine amidase [Candidatus Parcubacteria bacterium]|nr:N-acetylmuramoyl-L-alanine amidase [Candidatus Parcubacteria bacterium]
MYRPREYFFAALFLLFTFGLYQRELNNGIRTFIVNRNPASVFFTSSISSGDIRTRYSRGQQVRVLIVPGHDNEYFGTSYKNLVEGDMTLKLGTRLAELLKNDPKLSVTVTRDATWYTPQFANYFNTNKEGILAFINAHRDLMASLVDSNIVNSYENVRHNTAPSDVIYRLYGINKWANDNKMDIVLHVHFNDYPRRKNVAGEYKGFVIFVPERQYSNAVASKDIAHILYNRLVAVYASSDQPREAQGVTEDQELIAVGANNTVDGAAILTEYGYIYEPEFQDQNIQNIVLNELAFQTSQAVEEYVSGVQRPFTSTLLPHRWNTNIEKGAKYNPDILSMQFALSRKGLYPPPGKDRYDCSLTGNFGDCTATALAAFQKQQGINAESGFVGPRTREALNSLFGTE